jgi:hypothetical protein
LFTNIAWDNTEMKYLDKNGSEWSIEKGDWIGSFDRNKEKQIKSFITKLSIPLLLILILGAILFNWK